MFTKSIPRRILFLVSLPDTPVFNAEEERVSDCIRKLTGQGVVVRQRIDDESLEDINNFDIVILVAHHDEHLDALILGNRVLPMKHFVQLLPDDFKGTLDLSSCYSASILAEIKDKCPHCHVQAPVGTAALQLRLFMYPFIIRLLNEKPEIGYRDAYLMVLDTVRKEFKDGGPRGSSTKLGKNFSSIYAPKSVRRDNPFLIQLFIHNETDGFAVALAATNYDEDTRLVEKTELPIKLKRGDRLYARLDFVTPYSDQVSLDGMLDTKSIVWMNSMAKIQFCVTLSPTFPGDSLTCRILLEVNGLPIGECYCKLKVAAVVSDSPALIQVIPYNLDAVKMAGKKALLERLTSQCERLNRDISNESDLSIINRLRDSITICKNCIDLISAETTAIENPIKKVFVSSTSDLGAYRSIARREIISCNMFPEMSDDWEQTSLSPKEECCRRVLHSDIVLCILGARYGYVEESLGMSMTEIEYRTALESGKSILVFVVDPLNKTNEPISLANRQLALINEIKTSRILTFFSDESSFEKETIRQLSRL